VERVQHKSCFSKVVLTSIARQGRCSCFQISPPHSSGARFGTCGERVYRSIFSYFIRSDGLFRSRWVSDASAPCGGTGANDPSNNLKRGSSGVYWCAASIYGCLSQRCPTMSCILNSFLAMITSIMSSEVGDYCVS
jgi:hypothetical protein